MIKALLNGIMKIVSSFIGIILTPVNTLISNVFPDFSNAIASFNTFVSRYVGGTIAYFSSILPPITRSIIALWLTFLIGYYTITWSYALIIKIYNVIQKIKFW